MNVFSLYYLFPRSISYLVGLSVTNLFDNPDMRKVNKVIKVIKVKVSKVKVIKVKVIKVKVSKVPKVP